jgi:hypothetical protein
MAFHGLIFGEGMAPANTQAIMKSLNNLVERIDAVQKYIKTEDRKENINVVNGLIRGAFSKQDVAALTRASE